MGLLVYKALLFSTNEKALRDLEKSKAKQAEKKLKDFKKGQESNKKSVYHELSSDNYAEKAERRDEAGKFTKGGKFKRVATSTLVNPVAYWHSRLRQAVGKSGYSNYYDHKTQEMRNKSEDHRAKAAYHKSRYERLTGANRVEDSKDSESKLD